MIDCSPKESMDEARKNKKVREEVDKIKTRKRAKNLYEKMKKDNVSHVAKEAMSRLLHKKGTVKMEV